MVGINARAVNLLNTAYTFGSAGTATGWGFVCPVSADLTEMYFYQTAQAGAAGANVTVEIRSDTSDRPGATLHATQTIARVGGQKWNHVTFSSPFTMTAGTIYHVSIHNSDGTPGTNTITVLCTMSVQSGAGAGYWDMSGANRAYFPEHETTNGWSSATFPTGVTVGILKFSDGTIIGNPYTTGGASWTSNTRERGLLINSLPFDCEIYNVGVTSFTANYSGIKVYRDNTAPGGSTIATASQNNLGPTFTPPLVLTRNTKYRITTTFSVASTQPTYAQIDDYAAFPTDLQAVSYMQGKIMGTVDDGAGGWTDFPDRMPNMILGIRRILSGGNSWSS